MYTFERLTNGNVLFKKNGVIERVLPSKVYISADPNDVQSIVIAEKPANRNDNSVLLLNCTLVTTPVSVSRDDLINILATTIFDNSNLTINIGDDTTNIKNVQRYSASTTEILLSLNNSSKISVVIVNESSSDMYIKYGSGVSPTDYTWYLKKNYVVYIDDYHGDIYAVWNTAVGNAQVTELFI